MKITILGCGGSGGVPMIGGQWGACDPANPKNRRLRPSILVEEGGSALLVDTSPDLREQLLVNNIAKIDAVLYTHAHADHLHGIDDLRGINKLIRQPIPIYADQATLAEIRTAFGYVFQPINAEKYGYFRPQLTPNEIAAGQKFMLHNLEITPFNQDHGVCSTLGFRFNAFAYSTDVVNMPEESFTALAGVKLWVVDCFVRETHFTHAHLDKTLAWIERVKPERAILTHMGVRLDYATLKKELPPHVEP
ncbi:MAG: MBL fold metallo-hydrolase, partial [Dongiaceae bacterium]